MLKPDTLLSVADLQALSKCVQFLKHLDHSVSNIIDTALKMAKRVLKKEGDVNYQIPRNSVLWPEDSFHGLEYKEFQGGTLLHIACSHDYTNDIIEELLNLGANFTIQDINGSTALHLAFKRSNCHNNFSDYKNDSCIDLILSAHVKLANFSNPCDKNGFSHFHIACAANNIKAVQLFLENKVDVNQVISKESQHFPGFTALHVAIKCCSIEIFKLLLQHNADKNIKNADGMTSLVLLIDRKIQLLGSTRFNHKQTRRILENKVKKIEKMIFMLLEDTFMDQIDVVDSIGLSSFHIACTMQDVSIIENLIDKVPDISHCINVDSPVWSGYTAMHFAAHCNVNIMKLLSKKGGKIDVKNTEGLTPFDICLKIGYIEDIHEAILLKPELSNILFSDNKTSLANFLYALQDTNQLKHFLLNCVNDINMTLPIDSPIWPGCTFLYIAVILSRNYEDKYGNRFCSDNESILDQIKELLKNGSDVVIKDATGRTPLHYAYRESKNEVSKLLRKYHHSSENPVDNDNLSHLHIACAQEDKTLIKKLLFNDEIDLNTPYKGEIDVQVIKPGWMPLDCACEYSEVPRILEDRGAIYAPVYNKYDSNPLHSACDKGDKDLVQRLLELQADIHFVLDNGETPLHVAMKRQSSEIVELLLQQGADLFVKDNEGKTPFLYAFKELSRSQGFATVYRNLMYVVLKQHQELQEQLEEETGITMLHISCFMLDVDEVKKQLESGINVDSQTKLESKLWPGHTPLHVLTNKTQEMRWLEQEDFNDFDVIVKLLLENGSDVTLTNPENGTAVHMSNYFYLERVKLLLKYQRDYTINPVDNDGYTHLHLAVLANDVEVVEKFLEHGVDPNQPIGYFNDSFGGTTPLISAIDIFDKTQDLKIVNLLLKHGADVNLETEFGRSAIREVIGRSFELSLVEKLLRYGANIHTEETDGTTTFECLLDSGHASVETIRFFLKHGCRANASNRASDQGYLGIILENKDKEDRDSLFEELIKAPDVDRLDEYGRTLIHNVVATGDPQISIEEYNSLFNRFKQYGYDIEDQDQGGQTALHLAAKYFNERAISALFNAGADLNVVDADGDSALFYTSETCFRCYEDKHNNQYHGEAIATVVAQILKLQATDLYVSQSNRDYLAECVKLITHTTVELTEDFYRQIDEAKRFNIGSLSLTLSDFLSETKAVIRYSRMSVAERKIIDDVFESIDSKKFNEILPLLKLQHRKAVKRFHVIEAMPYLKVIVPYPLPDLCAEIVLSFLNIRDLKSVVGATDLMDFK